MKFLDLRAQYESIREEMNAAIAGVIESSSFIGGEELKSFEREFAAFQQADHCIGVGNGTDALEIALEALDLPPDSEVIVPAHSFIASSEAVTRSGLRVVFADVDDDALLAIDDIRRKITSNTSAVMAVHLYGHPAPMEEICALAAQRNIRVIEDCAQAHGAQLGSRRVGTFGDIGTFSFYPGKNLGAYGDGGAIVTNNEALAVRCRMIANHGRISKYDHEFEGRNSRLDTLQAAILRVKLRHLDGWIEQRGLVAERYLEDLAGVDGLALPSVKDARHAFHLFVIRTSARDQLRSHLSEKGIQTGIHYPTALPDLSAYAHLGQAGEFRVATDIANSALSLPIGEHMDVADASAVAREVIDFFAAYGGAKRSSTGA